MCVPIMGAVRSGKRKSRMGHSTPMLPRTFPRAERAPALVPLLCLATIVTATCDGQTSKPAPPRSVVTSQSQSQPTVDPAAARFGYTDDTGTRVLMLGEDGGVLDEGNARQMETAVCPEGREFPVRYLRFQKRSPESNGRQNPGNLKYDEGHLFEIVGTASEPGETCMLVPPGYLQAFPIVRNGFAKSEREQRARAWFLIPEDTATAADLAPFQAQGSFARATVGRLEKEKARKVRLDWLLHRADTAGTPLHVAAVEFEPMGDDLLGAVVLAEGERLYVFENPAKRTDLETRGGCWRVDDSCRFDQEEMDVPAVLGPAGNRLVFYTSGGPEGQLIILFQAKDGTLVKVQGAGRYQSPL